MTRIISDWNHHNERYMGQNVHDQKKKAGKVSEYTSEQKANMLKNWEAEHDFLGDENRSDEDWYPAFENIKHGLEKLYDESGASLISEKARIYEESEYKALLKPLLDTINNSFKFIGKHETEKWDRMKKRLHAVEQLINFSEEKKIMKGIKKRIGKTIK